MLIFMLMLMLMHIVYSVGGQEPKKWGIVEKRRKCSEVFMRDAKRSNVIFVAARNELGTLCLHPVLVGLYVLVGHSTAYPDALICTTSQR
jgi:hypothetical protein